jgi:hypothetical protein
MAQIFHPSTNTVSKVSILVALVLLVAGLLVAAGVQRSDYITSENEPRRQPVPFSHEHHVGGLGIDCRYCHTTVAESSFAGMPSTKTCMTCHSQIWTQAEVLAPVRSSWETGTPIRWNRIYDLPRFAYFHHGIHVQKGIGCVTCHGRVDEMPLLWRSVSLYMAWCLDCHRRPEEHLRPREAVYSMEWKPPADQLELGRRLRDAYDIRTFQLTDCSICHR